MKTLKQYIKESLTVSEELPEPIWNDTELAKFDKEADKLYNRTKFSDKSIDIISSKELSGEDAEHDIKVGDIIYKENPCMVVNIRVADKETSWDNTSGKYLITAVDADKNIYCDVASNWYVDEQDA